MATCKSSRKSKANQRPLDDDFLWEELPNKQAWPEFSLPSQLGNAPSATKQENSSVCGSSVGQPAAVEKEPGDYQHLKLLQETHKLEITKLKLQLELATLGSKTVLTGAQDASAKSQGDLRAPQRTLYPQPWPHIYAPGEPKLFNELSLTAFTAGYITIVNNTHDASTKQLMLEHLKHLMTLACSYQWSTVCSVHYKVLRSIEMGLVKWGDSFDAIIQPFLIPPNLLFETSKPSPRTNAPKTHAASTIPRSQICDEWSWYDNCSEEHCPKQHMPCM